MRACVSVRVQRNQSIVVELVDVDVRVLLAEEPVGKKGELLGKVDRHPHLDVEEGPKVARPPVRRWH